MGFLDKALEKTRATATQAMQQGQAKVNAYQQSRSEAELYRTLGEATYQAQRQGGDPAAVDAALDALDNHFAQAAAGDAAPTGASSSTGQATPSGTSTGTPPPSGNFTLDDM
jgi:hypothetical protein